MGTNHFSQNLESAHLSSALSARCVWGENLSTDENRNNFWLIYLVSLFVSEHHVANAFLWFFFSDLWNVRADKQSSCGYQSKTVHDVVNWCPLWLFAGGTCNTCLNEVTRKAIRGLTQSEPGYSTFLVASLLGRKENSKVTGATY